jgi:hypothetical protein
MGRPQNYYVVNAGRGRSATHIMQSKSPRTPNPLSPGSITAQLLWFGGNPKDTLCGLIATRHVDVFSPAEASCRECRRRWQLAQQRQAQKQAERDRLAADQARQAERDRLDAAKLAEAQNVVVRQWITANLVDVTLTDAASGARMRQVIRRRYPGGWERFYRDHLRDVQAQPMVPDPAGSERLDAAAKSFTLRRCDGRRGKPGPVVRMGDYPDRAAARAAARLDARRELSWRESARHPGVDVAGIYVPRGRRAYSVGPADE